MSNDVKLPERLEWRPCPCEQSSCKREYPTNLGTYYLGSGFDPDEKAALDDAWNARHQPQREAVLEEALLRCASRFSAYAELHAEKLWDGSLSEAQRQTVRDKVDRNLRYAAEARAALTTPASAAMSQRYSRRRRQHEG